METRKYYHASPAELALGETVVPGDSIGVSNFSDGASHRVFMSITLDEAEVWAELVGAMTDSDVVHIYEVIPVGRVYEKWLHDVEVVEFHAAKATVVSKVDIVSIPARPDYMRI